MLQPARPAPGRPDVDEVDALRKVGARKPRFGAQPRSAAAKSPAPACSGARRARARDRRRSAGRQRGSPARQRPTAAGAATAAASASACGFSGCLAASLTATPPSAGACRSPQAARACASASEIEEHARNHAEEHDRRSRGRRRRCSRDASWRPCERRPRRAGRPRGDKLGGAHAAAEDLGAHRREKQRHEERGERRAA